MTTTDNITILYFYILYWFEERNTTDKEGASLRDQHSKHWWMVYCIPSATDPRP